MGYTQDADNIVLTNEIKKELYKNKPLAHRIYVGHHQYKYYCYVDLNNGQFKCKFTVPVKDMWETEFTDSMPAQLLIRYLDIL